MPDSAISGERQFAPTRSYDIKLIVKDVDYSNDVTSCKLISSVNSVYDIVKLELFIDPNDILVDITGEDPLKLTIIQLGESAISAYDRIDLDLMYVKSGFVMPMRSGVENDSQRERSPFSISCIVRKAYKTMTTIVNKIYMGKTIKEIIEDLVQTNTNATVNVETDGLNSNVIDQVLIPPTTLTGALKYLDKTFGIYSGIANFNCSNDNEVRIMNLSKQLNMNPTFIIYQLAINTDETEIIKRSAEKDNVFYTHDTLVVQYSANSKMSTLAKNIKHIVKPSDTLYYEIDQDMVEISKDYGLIYSKRIPDKKLQFDPIINDRTRFYTEHTGYEKTDTFAVAGIAKATANITNVSFRIERNMNILSLVNAGESVKLNTEIQDYVKLAGKYILKSTVLDFEKTRDWEGIAKIFLMRTNKNS